MILLELLSRLQNSNTSLLFWNLFTGLNFLNELNIKFVLLQNSQCNSAFVSIWPRIYSASARSQHTLFTLCHSRQTSSSLIVAHRSFRHASPHLWNQLPTSLRIPHPNITHPPLRDLHLNVPVWLATHCNHLRSLFHCFTLSSKSTFSESFIFNLSLFLSVELSHVSRRFAGFNCSSILVLVLSFLF